MELSYRNNQKSLFRKYARLVTSLTKHQVFRDYLTDAFVMPKTPVVRLLPNGYIHKQGKQYQLVVTTKPVYAPKLDKALAAVDSIALYLKHIKEAQEVLLWSLGLTRRVPDISKRIYLNQLIFNPNPTPETTSVDGYAARESVDEIWATIRGGAGNGSAKNEANGETNRVATSGTSNQFQSIRRGIFLFDTSSLGSSITIFPTSKFSLYVTATEISLASQSVSVVQSTPASNTTIANSDYANVGTTLQAATATIASLTTSAYNDFTFNATGLLNIAVVGISKFGFVIESDRANAQPTWASLQAAGVTVNYADSASNKPKVTVDFGTDDFSFFL